MKTIKRILLCAVAICLCLSFSGCVTLDSLRKTHAVFQNEEETLIKLDGKRYKQLPRSPYLNPPIDPEIIIRVTDKDVPLLLHRELGYFLSISADKNILIKNEYDDRGYSAAYCKAALYDEIVERLNQPFEPDCITYTYYVPRKEKVETAVLTAEQQQVVYQTLETAKPITELGEKAYYTCVELFESSSDLLLRKSLTTIFFAENKIYLGDANFDTKFAIPEKYNAIFMSMRENIMY